jgi:hypothetical protein
MKKKEKKNKMGNEKEEREKMAVPRHVSCSARPVGG